MMNFSLIKTQQIRPYKYFLRILLFGWILYFVMHLIVEIRAPSKLDDSPV